jgi:hypothetical protein
MRNHESPKQPNHDEHEAVNQNIPTAVVNFCQCVHVIFLMPRSSRQRPTRYKSTSSLSQAANGHRTTEILPSRVTQSGRKLPLHPNPSPPAPANITRSSAPSYDAKSRPLHPQEEWLARARACRAEGVLSLSAGRPRYRVHCSPQQPVETLAQPDARALHRRHSQKPPQRHHP